MTINMTDRALEAYKTSGEDLAITLRDGVRLSGRVVDFDGYTLILSGNPDILLYRHSILTMLPASASVRPERPAARPQKPAAQAPRPQKPRAPKPARPQRQPQRHESRPQPSSAGTEPGFANPMADEMLKWLKSQKGGG